MSLASAAAVLAWLAIASIATPAWAQPDPNKVLRVAFPAAETGFDPQAAGDFYSNHVNRVIFDPLYRYDYLARRIAGAEHGGGHAGVRPTAGRGRSPGRASLRDDPVFKGQRRSSGADCVYAMKRCSIPGCARTRCRASTVASSAARPLSLKPGKRENSITTRRWRACRPSTATRCS
jgi:hypothetical protein